MGEACEKEGRDVPSLDQLPRERREEQLQLMRGAGAGGGREGGREGQSGEERGR